MPNDHSPELRQRVLRRVAERNDLAATAREFGLPADLVFQWLKENAESGKRLAVPTRRQPRAPTPADEASAAVASSAATRLAISIHAVTLGPMLLLLALGHVHPSVRAREACLPLWIVLGLAVFAWLTRVGRRSVEARGIEMSAASHLGLLAINAVLAGISACAPALALPAIPHRLLGKPIEVRTVVAGKAVYRGRHTSHCLQTPPFDPRIAPVNWCTRVETFNEARVGQGILLRGTTSWFGFQDKGFELLASPPANVSGAAAPEARPLPTAIGPPVQAPRPAPIVVGDRRAPAFGPGPAAPAVDTRAAPRDEALLAWPGDDLATIQRAYPDAPAPMPFHSADPANTQVLWLRERGMRFFLTVSGTVSLVRLDTPFAGAVHGVRLGDRLDDVQDRLGIASRQLSPTSMLFAADTGGSIRVDLDGDQRVRTIFLIR